MSSSFSASATAVALQVKLNSADGKANGSDGSSSQCNAGCLAQRRLVVRDMAKWGRQMLTLVGLENVFQRALGPVQWRKYSRAVKVSARAEPIDFCVDAEVCCNSCLGSRLCISGHKFAKMMNASHLNSAFSAGQQTSEHQQQNNNSSRRYSSSASSPLVSAASESSSLFPPLPFKINNSPVLFNTSSAPRSAIHQQQFVPKSSSNIPFVSAAPIPQPFGSNSTAFSPMVGATPAAAPQGMAAAATTAMAQFFAMQLMAQHQQNSSTTSNSTAISQRFSAIASAMQQFLAVATANIGSSPQNGIGENIASKAAIMAAAAALFTSSATAALYPNWPFSAHPLPPSTHQQNTQQQQQNGSPASSTGTTSPLQNQNPVGLDVQQQMAIWQYQLLALGLFPQMNGAAGIAPSFCGQQHAPREQLPSEEEAVAFLAAFAGSSDNKSPVEEQVEDKADLMPTDEKPLDLSKYNICVENKKLSSNNGTKRINAMGNEQQSTLFKQGNNDDYLSADEQIVDQMGQDGGTLLLEDGSEAESPKLGTKRTYSQADLDAAVKSIRIGKLGTRRASVIYGIPRSTLRNKIYKLEAAEDNGDGSSKRNRLKAYALNRREQRVASASHQRADLPQNCDMNLGAGENQNNTPAAVDSKTGTQNAFQQNIVPFPALITSSPGQLFDGLASFGHFQQPQPKRRKVTEKSNPLSTGVLVNGLKNEQKEEVKTTIGNGEAEQQREEDRSTAGGKAKIQRPKRGQYRKYDKDALDRAVASVRSGEMSVHRAGSHFGVPHSTLEYKVKERNLLRTRSKKSLGMGLSANEPTGTAPAAFPIGPGGIQPFLAKADQPLTPTSGEVRSLLDNLVEKIGNCEGPADTFEWPLPGN